jgi:hypothetical protein
MLEGFNTLRRTFNESFDAAVVKVPDITNNLVPSGRALRKKSVPNALHVTADQKLSRDFS